MTWTHELTDDYRNATSGQTSWTVAAGTVGDLRVIRFHTEAAINVSSLSGGGVSSWARAGSVNTSSGSGGRIEYWYGIVTSAGTGLTITYSSSIGSTSVRSLRADFRCDAKLNNLAVANTGYTDQTASSGTITWPTVTAGPYGTQLAVGFAWLSGAAFSGSSPGYTYSVDGNGNFNLYDTTVAPSSNQAPTATQSTGQYSAELVVFSNNAAAPNPGNAAATASAYGATTRLTVAPNAGKAAVTAAAYRIVSGHLGFPADVSAQASNPSVRIGWLAHPGVAQATAAGIAVFYVGLGIFPSLGTASATAFNPNVLLPGGGNPTRIYYVPIEVRSFVADPGDVRTFMVVPNDNA